MTSNLELKLKTGLNVPGDKSISHRSVLFSSLAAGKSEISGFLEAEDPLNTMKSFSRLGVKFSKNSSGSYSVESPGKKNLHSPEGELDFGNGGTGIRLSAGLISGLDGVSAVLTGDASLQKRPMKRITDPLQAMGADIVSVNDDGKIPLRVSGRRLKDFQYKSEIASAQVKSALMLAAISSDVKLDYEEEFLSRNHTENMLRALGGKITHLSTTRFVMEPSYDFTGYNFRVPGDISSAAFWIVLGLVAKGGLLVQNVGLNPARTGILDVLRSMGGKIEIENSREECGEPVGDIRVYSSKLHKAEITKDQIPSIIDEIPVLTMAGLFSEGGFEIRHAEELRAKESDRIHAVVSNLQNLGVKVDEFGDGYSFGESKVNPGKIKSFMDHRIAMSFMILSALSGQNLEIDDTSWIDTSFPGFEKTLKGLVHGG